MTDSRKQEYSNHKLLKRLQRNVGQAIADFNMIEADDRVMVCLSGGKDSYAMLDILIALRRRAQLETESSRRLYGASAGFSAPKNFVPFVKVLVAGQ